MDEPEKRGLQEHATRADEHVTKSAKVHVHAESDCEHGMRVDSQKHFLLVQWFLDFKVVFIEVFMAFEVVHELQVEL